MKKEEVISSRCEIKKRGTSMKDAFKCLGENEAPNLFKYNLFVSYSSVTKKSEGVTVIRLSFHTNSFVILKLQ